MNFDEVINKRRTARVFTSENVSKEQLSKILKSASTAPSARNRQPWRFYILNDSQKKHIMNMLIDWEKENSKESEEEEHAGEGFSLDAGCALWYDVTERSEREERDA